MKLHELHVHQFRAGVIRERLAVAGVFPGIASDFVGAPDAAGGKHNGLCLENFETPALAVVAKRADDAVAILEQRDHRVFHVDVDALMDAVVLKRANQFQTGAVADVGEARITVAAEIALENFPVLRAVKHRAPCFEFVNARRGFLGVQFGHAPVVDVLAAAHRVGEMHAPVVAVVHVAHRRRHAALGHDGVRLAEQRFADQPDLHAGRRRLDGRAQARAARADDEHVVFKCFVVGGHWKNCFQFESEKKSPVMPDAHRA